MQIDNHSDSINYWSIGPIPTVLYVACEGSWHSPSLEWNSPSGDQDIMPPIVQDQSGARDLGKDAGEHRS